MLNDAIVIGGSYAGMAAALQLARARRKVLIVDVGERRNRFAAHAHGFLTQDGAAPGKIFEQARDQLLTYPSVRWVKDSADKAAGKIDEFTVSLSDGTRYEARRLIIATGVADSLPDIPGLRERWGSFVFHCPYCHGYELNEGSLGVLALGPLAVAQALMISEWGPTTLFVNGTFEPDIQQCTLLSAGQISIDQRRIREFSDDGRALSLRFRDGESASVAGLFVMPKTRLQGSFAHQLGCELEEGITGSYIRVDAMKQTSVDGVYAAGDTASMAGSITFAASDGARAGISAHHSFIAGFSAVHSQISKCK